MFCDLTTEKERHRDCQATGQGQPKYKSSEIQSSFVLSAFQGPSQ